MKTPLTLAIITLALMLAAPLPASAADADPTSPTLLLNLKQTLPGDLARALQKSHAAITESERQATISLKEFLDAEVKGDFRKAFDLLTEGSQQKLLNSETSRAIINDINLYKKPPANPSPGEKEAIARVSALVKADKLSVDEDNPALWVYQWGHETGTIEAYFEVSGPYTLEFLLRGYSIADVHLAKDDLAIAWLSEDILVPVGITLKRLSIYLLKPENGKWKMYGHRAVDGPQLNNWLGFKTTLWPDQLEYQVHQHKNEE